MPLHELPPEPQQELAPHPPLLQRAHAQPAAHRHGRAVEPLDADDLDVILDAGGKTVSTPKELSAAVGEARKAGKHTILMRVRSAQATRYVALPVA